MSTSLAEQLRRLAAPQTSNLFDSKKRPSILFDAKEAAEKDRSTIYEIGYNGLMELAALNPAFLQFEKTLFDRSTMTFERSVESDEVNRQLNKTIKRFFYYLSPYFMLQPAHMCLEWLIRRYNIHHFNKNELLQLVFPYHETKIFIRCLQILKLKNTNDTWSWLYPIQAPGVPLSRTAVLNRAATDPAFLKFICKSTTEAVKELDNKAHTLQAQFAFYCTSVIGALEYAGQVSEWHVTTILPSVLRGMSSKVLDFCAAAYMIAAQLVVKTQLSTKLLQALISKVSQVEHACLHGGALSLLVVIFQNQPANGKEMSRDSLKRLINHEWLPTAIDTLAKKGALISCICEPLVGGCLQGVQTKGDNWQELKLFLENFLLVVHLKGNEAKNLIRCVLDNYCTQKPKPLNGDSIIEIDSDDDDMMLDGDIKGWYSEILKQLDRQYPEEFDFVLKETMQGQGSISQSRRESLKTALSFRLKSLYLDDNASIYENLYHYNSRNRAEAVKYLVKNFDKLNVAQNEVVKDSLLDRLSDDEPSVLSEILKLSTEAITKTLGSKETVNKLVEILHKKKPKSDKWAKVISKALDHLLHHTVWQDNHLHKVILAIVPFLFPVTPTDVSLAKQILSSEVASAVPLLKKISKDVVNVEDPKRVAEIVEDSLLKAPALLDTEDLINSFVDMRNSVGYLLLISSYKKATDAELGVKVVNQILEMSKNYKLTVSNDGSKWYQVLNKDEIPLQLFLNGLKIVAERTEFQLSEAPLTHDRRCVFAKVFEILLTRSFTSKPDEGKEPYTAALSSMLNTRFASLESKLEFMANYFIGNPAPESEEKLEIQIRAIRLFTIAAASAKANKKLSRESFVKVLVALSNKTDLVRECTLKALANLCESGLLGTKFEALSRALIERTDELLLDHEQFPLILFTIIATGKSDKKQMIGVLDELVQVVVDQATHNSLKAEILNILKHINNPSVFKKLLPAGLRTLEYIEKMDGNTFVLDKSLSSILHFIISRIDNSTVRVLNEEPNAWLFVKNLLKCHRIRSTYEGKPVSVASALIDIIDDDIYSKLSDKLKCEFVEEVVTALTYNDDPAMSSNGSKLMRRICLQAKHIEVILVRMRSACTSPIPEKTKSNIACLTRPLNPDVFNSAEWKNGITLLELLQNKKKIEEFASLVDPLVEILKKCLEFEEQSNFEYAKQLILSALLQCCQKLVTDRNALANLKEKAFRIDLVVQCIRATQNPQTHHHALMLLAQCASIFPEQVLHNIMDIFTFMGSSVVRHDDAFSFQIISRIIESIVPTLVNIESDEGRGSRVVAVLRVFSDIALDVPEHRRFPLYTKLIRTLNAKEYLWMFLCVLLEAHVIHDDKDKSEKRIQQHRFSKNANDMPKRVEFALQLMKDFDPKVALETCKALFDYINKLPTEKDESTAPMEVDTDEIHLFNLNTCNAKQLRHFKYVLVQVISSFTSSAEFLNQIAALTDEETAQMKPYYQDFIIKILCYVPQVTGAMEHYTGTNQLQYWKVMLHHCYDVLENAISLLSPDMLLVVVHGLMEHRLPSVRKKVIEILISKLQHRTHYFANCNEEYLLNLLQSLNDILNTILDKEQSSSTEILFIQQSALIANKLLSRFLAIKYVDAFKEILTKLTKVLKKHDSIPRIILAAVLLTTTEICSNLKAHAISQLSKFMPYVIEILQAQSDALVEQAPDNVSIAIVTGVQKLFDALPLFLGPYMVDMVSSLVKIWIQLERYQNEPRASITVNKLTTIWMKIAETIPLRVIVPTCDKTYKKLIDEQQFAAIKYLMKLLNECFAHAPSEDIQSLQADTAEFYLNTFDFRVKNMDNMTEDQLQQTEESILESFVSLVLKLSESSFRPLYQKVYDWAFRNNESKDRVITYFVLSAKIAKALKSLFVLFAGDIIKDAADILDRCNPSKMESDLYFADSVKKNKIIVQSVLNTLHRIFLHDSKDFINEHRFDVLMQPIVDQLQSPLILEDEPLKDLLKSCIAELAHVTHNDTLWNRLNYQILLKTRSNNPEIRIIAMSCCVEIAEKLGEQFIPLLPETVPFIAELFEDEVEKVEKSCRRGVQQMEKSLGISMQEYF